MIDTKQTYEELLGVEFTARQAEALTRMFKAQDAEKIEKLLNGIDSRLTVVETKLNMVLYALPILIVGCTAVLGWLITTAKHP